jgi:hypothetical protein
MNFCQAGVWDSVKSTATKVGDTTSDLVSDDEATRAQERQKINNNAIPKVTIKVGEIGKSV